MRSIALCIGMIGAAFAAAPQAHALANPAALAQADANVRSRIRSLRAHGYTVGQPAVAATLFSVCDLTDCRVTSLVALPFGAQRPDSYLEADDETITAIVVAEKGRGDVEVLDLLTLEAVDRVTSALGTGSRSHSRSLQSGSHFPDPLLIAKKDAGVAAQIELLRQQGYANADTPRAMTLFSSCGYGCGIRTLFLQSFHPVAPAREDDAMTVTAIVTTNSYGDASVEVIDLLKPEAIARALGHEKAR